ncbi:hypothetical protein QBC39DRAFT_147741 [Podospora conica]|nr:hypothetical protein QBC39DRAFT_147741 [Schizothecium conicum]
MMATPSARRRAARRIHRRQPKQARKTRRWKHTGKTTIILPPPTIEIEMTTPPDDETTEEMDTAPDADGPRPPCPAVAPPPAMLAPPTPCCPHRHHRTLRAVCTASFWGDSHPRRDVGMDGGSSLREGQDLRELSGLGRAVARELVLPQLREKVLPCWWHWPAAGGRCVGSPGAWSRGGGSGRWWRIHSYRWAAGPGRAVMNFWNFGLHRRRQREVVLLLMMALRWGVVWGGDWDLVGAGRGDKNPWVGVGGGFEPPMRHGEGCREPPGLGEMEAADVGDVEMGDWESDEDEDMVMDWDGGGETMAAAEADDIEMGDWVSDEDCDMVLDWDGGEETTIPAEADDIEMGDWVLDEDWDMVLDWDGGTASEADDIEMRDWMLDEDWDMVLDWDGGDETTTAAEADDIE